MNKISKILQFVGKFEPIGSIKMYGGAAAPSGWLKCDGSAVSRTTYNKLFEAIGTAYGAGDGSTTFNLPDLTDRMPIGAGNLYAIGAQGGSKDAIIPYHNHSVNAFNTGGMSANETHNHFSWDVQGHNLYSEIVSSPDSGSTKVMAARADARSAGSTQLTTSSKSVAHTHQVGAHNTNYAGAEGNATNANLPPYTAINYIIFAGV